MSVLFVIQLDGVDKAKYGAVMKELGLDKKKGAKWPKGIVSHTAGTTPSGLCVVDVWESEKEFQAFLESRLQPVFAKVGGIPQPRIIVAKVLNQGP